MQNGGFVNKIQGVRLSVAKIHRHVFENPGCISFPVLPVYSFSLQIVARKDFLITVKGKVVSATYLVFDVAINIIKSSCQILDFFGRI